MTNEELIKLGKEEILKNYKQLYISRYTAVFGKAPSCASCSFSKDFRAFKEKIRKKETNLKLDTMATGYKLNPRFNSTILSYQTDKGIKRIYGRNMTDEFAEAFLTNGSKKQIAERKKMFVEIPEKKESPKEPEEVEVKTESTDEKVEEVKESKLKKRRKKRK